MTIPNDEVARIARGLTKAQRSALMPLTVFSDQTGREMLSAGLMTCTDHVWHQTPLGIAVRAILKADRTLGGTGGGDG